MSGLVTLDKADLGAELFELVALAQHLGCCTREGEGKMVVCSCRRRAVSLEQSWNVVEFCGDTVGGDEQLKKIVLSVLPDSLVVQRDGLHWLLASHNLLTVCMCVCDTYTITPESCRLLRAHLEAIFSSSTCSFRWNGTCACILRALR